MRKFLIALVVLAAVFLWAIGAFPAAAQNVICATAPPGTSDNRCASTAFVAGATAGIPLAIGSTVITGGTSGRVLYDNAGILGEIAPAALTKSDDTNVTLTLGGTPATALLAATSIAAGWTGQLAVSRGGSGAATLTGLLQGNGTSAFTAITNSSTVGQVLRVTGAATYAWGALDLADTDAVTGLLPGTNGGTGVNNGSSTITIGGNVTFSGGFTFTGTITGNTSVTFPTSGTLATTAGASIPAVVQGDLLYGSAANVLSALTKDTNATRYLSNTGSSNNPAWAQVNLANGVTGTLTVPNGGTGIASGTSGGIPYFSASTTIASSAALAANQLVLGGGAGTAPATLGTLGTATTVLHGNAAGAPTFGAVVSADLNITATSCTNQFVTAISSGGVGTCTTATLASAQFANQGTTTTVLHGNAAGNPSFAAVSLTADVSGILPGANGGTGNGFFAVSGPTTSLKTFAFPDASATVLTTNAAVTVGQGGTGITSGTSGGIPYFSSTSTIASSALLTANAIVKGGGAGTAPAASGVSIDASNNVSGAGTWSGTGAITALSGTAIPAGGTAGSGFKFSSTSNFGTFFGSGAPTLSAAQGSYYMRSDGSDNMTRAYVNSDGSTTWKPLLTNEGALVLLGYASGVNLNSAATDTAVTMRFNGTRYRVNVMIVLNTGTTASLTTATIGLFTSTGGGGTQIIADTSLNTITSNAIGTPVNSQQLVGGNTVSFFNNSTLQVRVGTAQGAAATADVFLFGYSVP